MKRLRPLLLTLPLLLLASCNRPAEPSSASGTSGKPDTPSAPASGGQKRLKIGYVLHGLNPFTAVIQRGAEQAGRDLNVDVEVTGPSSFEATEAIASFEGMVQKKVDGLAVIPMPGEVWAKPIKEAISADVPVVTANITSAESGAPSWFGQDEYQSGVILATELRKMLDADGKKSGKILVGNCKPGVAVLDERVKGLKKGLEGSAYALTDPKDVGTEKAANYSAWENQATANPDAVAAVGVCSMDIPNLAQLKKKSSGKWLIGGYDLDKDIVASIKDGTTQISLGQHPYLQGYLPVFALVHHLRDKTPLPKGWVNVGTEIVTKANIDAITPRETDPAEETKWYKEHVAKNFGDVNALAKPLPAMHP